MSIKDSLPSSYLSFIEKYDKPFEVVDKKTGTKWNIATLNDSSFCLENYATLIQELADEACDFYSDISNRKQVSKDFIKNFLVIGRHTDYFLCLNGEEVWQIVLDPGEIKKLSDEFKKWKVEIFNSNLKSDDKLKSIAVGSWIDEDGDKYYFKEDQSLIMTIDGSEFNYKWKITVQENKKMLWLYYIKHKSEEWCKITSLTKENFIYIEDGDEVNLKRID